MPRHKLAAVLSRPMPQHCPLHGVTPVTPRGDTVHQERLSSFTVTLLERWSPPPVVVLEQKVTQPLGRHLPASTSRYSLAAGHICLALPLQNGCPRPQLPLAGLLQGVSFFRGVICTREIQQAKSYRVFLHTTVETVTELYLSVTVVDAYLLFTDCRILPITALVGTDTRRNMHSGETITKDVYTALSTFIVLNTFQ